MTTTNGQKDKGTTTERFAAKAHDTVDDAKDKIDRRN